ncbi:hypothetical protein [Streptomyces lateritius]|uniref:hypothetical protein n=1 Tax=Streptomyces lateritius TaxID=67313 RepID=UPI001678A14F
MGRNLPGRSPAARRGEGHPAEDEDHAGAAEESGPPAEEGEGEQGDAGRLEVVDGSGAGGADQGDGLVT